MQKAQISIGKHTVISAEGESAVDVMAKLSKLAQVFAGVDKCGKCGCDDIAPNMREPEKFVYYEFQCLNPACGARLSLGQSKNERDLFQKRKNEDGGWKENDGWEVYSGYKPPLDAGTSNAARQQPVTHKQPPQADQPVAAPKTNAAMTGAELRRLITERDQKLKLAHGLPQDALMSHVTLQMWVRHKAPGTLEDWNADQIQKACAIAKEFTDKYATK